MAKLVKNVYVDGVLYTPESDVPAEVASQITNPSAWDEAPSQEEAKSTRRGRPAKKTEEKPQESTEE